MVEFCEWWSDESGGVKWSEMVNIGGVLRLMECGEWREEEGVEIEGMV